MGTDEDTLIRLLGGSDKHTVKEICHRYHQKYDKNLIETIKNEVGGDFKESLIAWMELEDPTGGLEQQVLPLLGTARTLSHHETELLSTCLRNIKVLK
jgi:hypothetical protein